MIVKRKTCFLVPAVYSVIVVALMVPIGFSGCSYIPFMHSDKDEKKNEKTVRTLWKSGEQYVAIVKQDYRPGFEAKANEHITEISVDRLRGALASMDLLLPGKDKSIALFNEEELRILSEYLAEGLALSSPDEDVAFVIIGNYVEALGFLKKRMVTGGRVFCQDGQINIIFGDVHRILTETMGIPEDRRIKPFMIGTRSGPVGDHEGLLLPKPGSEIFGKLREDWVFFPVKAPENLASPQESVPSEPVTKEIAPPPSREGATPAPAARTFTPAVKKSVEERLMILNELRNKKLISEEEYRTKRLDILNDL